MDQIILLLNEYGLEGFLVVSVIYFLMKSNITIHYPRKKKKS